MACLLINLTSFSISAESLTDAEIEVWLEDDAEERALSVNEGLLVFLPDRPLDKPVHQLSNRITIVHESLNNGWVKLHQCHKHIDAVPDAQIVYRYNTIKNLRLISYQQIERAWIEQQSVQMKNIQHNAELCIEADVKLLKQLTPGVFSIHSGPFHRQFLDGFYPMQVNLSFNYPVDSLRFSRVEPAPQPGFKVMDQSGLLTIEALFEGKLTIDIQFSH